VGRGLQKQHCEVRTRWVVWREQQHLHACTRVPSCSVYQELIASPSRVMRTPASCIEIVAQPELGTAGSTRHHPPDRARMHPHLKPVVRCERNAPYPDHHRSKRASRCALEPSGAWLANVGRDTPILSLLIDTTRWRCEWVWLQRYRAGMHSHMRAAPSDFTTLSTRLLFGVNQETMVAGVRAERRP
jgi:hypothetical protein